MNKKIIAIVLAALMVVMCLAFYGCGDKDNKTTTAESTQNVNADAQSDLAYIKSKGTLVIGMTDFAPMNYKENKDDTEWTGFDTEFAQAVCAKLGVKAEFIEIKWDNKFAELNSKAIDCAWNGMTIDDAARNASSVSDPYARNAQVVVMKADKVENFADTASMKDLKFVAEAGSAGEKEAKKICSEENYVAVENQSDALTEVKSGSADACVIDLTMAKAMTGEGTSYADLGYKVELSEEEYGIAFRKGSDVTSEVNKLMADLKTDGTLDKLAEKYGIVLVK